MILPCMKDARKRNQEDVKYFYDQYIINDFVRENLINKKYYIETYGCQMNVHDSEQICGILEEHGLVVCSSMEEADVVILNTCAIRENAHNKVFGMAGRIKHLKEVRKDIIAILCGCMAQEEGVVQKIRNQCPFIDIVFGTHNLHELPTLLANVLRERKQEIAVYSIEGHVYESLPNKRDSKYKAWVNIMYGCDKFCTYCIVPFTRGKQRSRKLDDIVNEVKSLVKDGYQEVTLLGQNVNAYGKDFDASMTFANLLEQVAKTKIPRIRFVTSHPWDFTNEMIEIIGKYDNIMPYIHLPLQSGSNRILKKMGRRYTREEYITLFNKIKATIPNVSITTDIIVGFPNETDEEFEETLSLYKELKFDLAYTFIYSKREETVAAKMEDVISLETKKERLARLNELVNHYAKENNLKYLDKVVAVLIEGPSDKANFLAGYTDTMKLINIKGHKDNIGKIKKVKITEAKTWSLDGVIVDD